MFFLWRLFIIIHIARLIFQSKMEARELIVLILAAAILVVCYADLTAEQEEEELELEKRAHKREFDF